jgi:hypothetical protein
MPGPARLAGKDDDWRRDWLDRRRFYIDAVVTLAVATTGFGPLALTIPVVVCWTTMGARDQPGGMAVCRLGVAGHQVAGDGRP